MKVQSFDVFDTLVARKCIEPTQIFEIVERQSGINGFANLRILAERNIISNNYTFNDIYVELKKISNYDEGIIDDLMALELAVEIENCIPIKSNLNNVRNGDVLISDMYHSKEFILKILNKCGLNKQVTLIVTSGGKAGGWVWGKLEPYFTISQHSGDNLHSDIKSPLDSNIFSYYTDAHKLTRSERLLFKAGFTEISKIVRQLRLSFLDDTKEYSSYLKDKSQIEYNVPMLLLGSIYIKYIALKNKSENILFSSRDCFYLMNVYSHIFDKIDDINYVKYFYTSRKSRIKASDSYIKYFQSIANGKSLVVDLCGTGWSLSSLYENSGIYPDTLFLVKIDSAKIPIYSSIRDVKHNDKIISPITSPSFDTKILELMNYVNHGMVEDVMEIDSFKAFHPVLEDPKYTNSILKFINSNEVIVEKLLDILSHNVISKMIKESFENINFVPDLMFDLCDEAAMNIDIYNDVLHYHDLQDQMTILRLKNT